MRIVCLAAVAACVSRSPGEGELTVRRRELMSTYMTISVAAPESQESVAAIDAAFQEIERLETVISEWRPGSEISTVVKNAGGAPVPLSAEAFALLARAKEISAATDGAFDVTVGALWGAWDFRWQEPRVPSPAELARRTRLIDWTQLELDPARRTARLAQQGMALTLGGIGKGYAADRAAAILVDRGFPNHIVAAGGDLRVGGTKYGKKWRVGIRDPRLPGIWGTLDASDESISTSGYYEKFFIRDGVRYHHILDPDTGMPARGVASCTVIAKDSTTADGLDTGFFVMGVERGLEAARTQGVEALFFTEPDFAVKGTDGFMARVQPLAEAEALVGRPPQQQ